MQNTGFYWMQQRYFTKKMTVLLTKLQLTEEAKLYYYYANLLL